MDARGRSGSFPVYENPEGGAAAPGIPAAGMAGDGRLASVGEAIAARGISSPEVTTTVPVLGGSLPVVSPLAVGSPGTGFVVGSAPAQIGGFHMSPLASGAGEASQSGPSHWAPADDTSSGSAGGTETDDGSSFGRSDSGAEQAGAGAGGFDAFSGSQGMPSSAVAPWSPVAPEDKGDDNFCVPQEHDTFENGGNRGRSASVADNGAPVTPRPLRARAMSAPVLETIAEDAPAPEMPLGLDMSHSLGSGAIGSPLSPRGPSSPELASMLQRAVQLYSKALAVKARCDSSVRPLSPSTVDRMSQMFVDSGDASVGQKLLARATGIFSETLGSGHPSVASALKLSGCLHVQSREYDLAMQRFVPAVHICEAAFGPGHSVTADVVFNVALLHSYRGEYAESVECLESVLETYCSIHGEDSGPACAVRAKLGVARRAFAQEQYTVRFEAGLEAQAAADLPGAVEAFEACLEVVPEDPTAAIALAGCFSATGDVEAALGWVRRALEWGYTDEDALLEDGDLAALRECDAFWELLRPTGGHGHAEHHHAPAAVPATGDMPFDMSDAF